jgi:hypothetical protein
MCNNNALRCFRVLKTLLLSTGVLSCVVTTFAAVNYRDNYRDMRWMGRGGAGLAAVTDGTAAFFNPGGLARNEVYRFNFIDFGLGGNQNLATSYSTFTTLTSGTGTLSEKFSPLLGVPLAVEGNFFPHIAIPGMMFGFWDYGDGEIQYRDPVFPRLEVYLRNDYGLIFGGGQEILPNLFFGATLRYQRRTYIDENINSGTLLNASTSYLLEVLKKGYGFGANIGLQYTPKVTNRQWSSIGLVVEDLGGTSFKNATRLPTPATQMQKVSTGISYGAMTPFADLSIHVDVKDILRKDESYTKRLHMGVEADFGFMSARAGFNQGYWTLGSTIALLPLIDLDLVTYGEEQGVIAGQNGSRYYLVGLKIGMDLKQSKKSSGKKQKYSLDKIK